jgi:hypothetical protein
MLLETEGVRATDDSSSHFRRLGIVYFFAQAFRLEVDQFGTLWHLIADSTPEALEQSIDGRTNRVLHLHRFH